MRLHGDKILQLIDSLFEELGLEYWLFFGTMLGAYREHGFIHHDDDIDLGMYTKDITESFITSLVRTGFVLKRRKSTSDCAFRMVSFSYKGVTVDFYGFRLDEKNDLITGFETHPIYGSWEESQKQNKYCVCLVSYPYQGLTRLKFNRLLLPVPTNTDYVLKGLYGSAYMTPQKGNKGYSSTISKVFSTDVIFATRVNSFNVDY